MTRTLIGLTFAAALCGAAAPAAAQSGPSEERSSVSVRVADLDLSSAQGRRTFESRIRIAAGRACDAIRSNSASDEAAIAECRDGFLRDARTAAAEKAGTVVGTR